MDAILAATTIHQKRQALDRMANGPSLQDAYNTTLDRIRQQDQSKSKLGMAVLMWVSRCERPLRSEELSHALGVDLGAEGFTIDNVPSVRTILSCTLGLVTIDENTSTVRLLHFTLQEYLGTSPTLFETPQSMMAEICLTYLNSPSVRRPRPNLDRALAESPFLEYATCFWGTHAAKEATERVKSQALRLLDGYENHVSVAIFWRERIRESYLDWDVYEISGLHCIAFWGIEEIAIAMLEAKKWDVNGRDSRNDTPLMWAVRYGNDRVVELLLGQGDVRTDVDIRGGRTVFSFAAESGNEGAVKLLLERGGVNPDISDINGRTPLSFATSRGCEGMVKLLLGRGDVNPNSLDFNGRPPLSYAAAGRHGGVVKLLVESRGIDPNSSDSDGLTALSYAAKWGRVDLVQWFLENRDVNPDLPDSSGRTPLSYAASRGHEAIIRLLLERWEVNPNSSDRNGLTPLSYAAISGAVGVAKLLLERWGVNPDLSDINGRTPLSFAALRGHEGIVKLLLRHLNVNPDSSDRYGLTSLSYAAILEDESVVRLLLERGSVNPDSSNIGGQTPQSFAAISGAGGVQLHLETANHNLWGNDGRTLLLFAAGVGDQGLVRVLLERNDVNPDSSDYNRRTPLSLAASGGHGDVAKLLLERSDVNSNSPDCSGRTPLSYAASEGHEGVVRLLLKRNGVNPDSWDYNRRTNLPLPTLGGHEGIAKLFLGREVGLNSPDLSGKTPLSYAISGGHENVVELFLEYSGFNPNSSASLAALLGYRRLPGPHLTRFRFNSSYNHGQMPLFDASMMKRWAEVRPLSRTRNSDRYRSDNRNRMPTPTTSSLASYQEITHPRLTADNVILHAADDPPVATPISSSVPSRPLRNRPLPFKLPPAFPLTLFRRKLKVRKK